MLQGMQTVHLFREPLVLHYRKLTGNHTANCFSANISRSWSLICHLLMKQIQQSMTILWPLSKRNNWPAKGLVFLYST